MKNEITSRFWDHIDGALVINLDECEDRWSEVKEVLEGFIPAGKYQRLSAVNGKSIEGYGQRPWFTGRAKDFRWAGRAGCTLSHRKALEEGLRRGCESFLILEDDLALGSLPEGFMDRLADVVFEEATVWDLCYLGFTNPRGPASLIQQVGDKYSLCRIRGALTTHAYLVKAPLARWLLERLPSEETIWSWCAGRRSIDRRMDEMWNKGGTATLLIESFQFFTACRGKECIQQMKPFKNIFKFEGAFTVEPIAKPLSDFNFWIF